MSIECHITINGLVYHFYINHQGIGKSHYDSAKENQPLSTLTILNIQSITMHDNSH